MQRTASCLRIPTLALLVALLAPPVMLAQEEEPAERFDAWFGRSTIGIPTYTERGDWFGSWWYINRDYHVGLWVRPGDNGPEMKVQVFRLGGKESFTTDWSGDSDYIAKGGTGTFRFDILSADDNRAEAAWFWNLEFPNSARKEEGALKIYRTGDGRHVVFLMIDGEVTLRRGTEIHSVPLAQTWTFRKASRRLIGWDEFPF